MAPTSTVRDLSRVFVAALFVFSWNPANAQNTGGSTGNGTGQQTKPAESKPAQESPFKDSKFTAQEQAAFNNLVDLWDKSEEAIDKLEYARKCGTKADVAAAEKANKEAYKSFFAAVDQYIVDFEPHSTFSKPPPVGDKNYDFFTSARTIVKDAVNRASKYKHKPVGDCPKKAAEAPPTKTVPGEGAPIHSSNRHKHKRHCTEDQPCYMENDQPAYAVAPKRPHHTDEGSDYPSAPPPSEGETSKDTGTQYPNPDNIPHGEPNSSGGNPWGQPP